MPIDEEVEDRFSDNYFDVLPGEGVTVSIKSNLTPKQFEEGFRWIDLGGIE